MSKRKLQQVSLLVNSQKDFDELESDDELYTKKQRSDDEIDSGDEEFDEEDGDIESDLDDDEATDAAKALIAKLKKQMERDDQSDRKASKRFRNKQRVLVLCSQGTTARYRHIMEDVRSLLPHNKKESKLGKRESLNALNEICEIRSCNNCIYFEMKKQTECFMWVSKTPNGPSARFQLSNIHTLAELKLIGNCLLGSRPILLFDKNFDSAPHWQLIKEMFSQAFGTPRGHPKSKPFIDHVFSFFIVDNRIWFRNYQLAEKDPEKKKTTNELVEIGPRFVLNPVRIFSGSFGGPTLYQNADFLAAMEEAKIERLKKSGKYREKITGAQLSKERKKFITAPMEDPLADVFKQ